MKCPQCGFLCSDLRDVCGKCFVDLRPRKTELGIKIIRPDAPYEELVAKVAKKVQQQTAAREKGGLFGSLLSLVSSAPEPSTTRWVPIEQKETEPEPLADLPSSVTPIQTTLPPQSAQKQPGRSVKFKRSSAAIQADAPLAETQESDSVLSPSPLDELSIDELWNRSFEAIAANGGGIEFEFHTSQLRSYAPEKEEIEILWALSDEGIQDPDSLRRYQSIATSETRHVEAETAKKALETVEKRMSAPVFSLKRGGPKLTRQDEAMAVDADVRVPTHVVDPATRGERIASGVVDLFYIVVLSVVFTFGAAWFAAPELRGKLIKLSSMPMPELCAIGAVFGSFLLLLSFLYPWFAGTRTAGQKLYGLAVIERTGRDASQSELFLRSAMLPISALLGLILPPFWGDLGFHNRLSNTITTRLSAENE